MLKLDKSGKPYIQVDKPTLRYETSEPIKDKDGKTVGHRQVEKEVPQEPEIYYNLESRGYFKKLLWSVLTKETSYVKETVEGTEGKEYASFKPFTGYVITYWLFDGNSIAQNHLCNNPQIYLRKMGAGCYYTCANCGVTTGPLATDKFAKQGTKKLKRRQVTKELAKQLYYDGLIDYIDISLRRELGLPDM